MEMYCLPIPCTIAMLPDVSLHLNAEIQQVAAQTEPQMNTVKQVFETQKKWRWNTFKWTWRLILAGCCLSVPVVFITLGRGLMPILPLLTPGTDSAHHLANRVVPLGLNKQELKKYKGFDAFLQKKPRQFNTHTGIETNAQVRAAFYVDWDPQSFYSLQQNVSELNMVVPEWFFIDPVTDTLRPEIDRNALQLMKKNHLQIIPLINNINSKKSVGEFDGDLLHEIFHHPAKQERLITDIIKYVKQYQLQGVNIDFEEFKERSDEPIIAFQKALYTSMHAAGLLVTQDIVPNDADFNVKELFNFNDYLFLMAYDEHYSTSVPGAISSQQWIEKMLDEMAGEVPSGKIILAFAGYGYDWPANGEATTVTYQEALSDARQYQARVFFDNNSYNNHYSYKDADSVQHQVFFADAASDFNTIRFADEYGTAGTALWRLGSEDDRLWTYYDRSLTNKSLARQPFDYNAMKFINTPIGKPDYIGDGEILNVVSTPEAGKINIDLDSSEQLIAEQRYLQLPTKYVIKKYGNVNKEVVLTFDDGPDPEYTPQILDILKRENVPAAFFVVGMQAENNLPLLKRIAAGGYEIGNHTFTHPNIAAVSTKRATAEMESTRLLIEAATDRSTVLFRAPFNADAEPTTAVELKPIALSRLKNYYTVGESIDPNDWEPGITADTVYARTIQQYESNPSKGIILLHDAGGDRQATVDALPRIIHYFKQKGVRFTTVASLIGKSYAEVMPTVNSNLVTINGGIATVGYWSENFIGTAFRVAILLSLGRIMIMAFMAWLQKRKAGRQKNILPSGGYLLPPVSIIVPAYNEEMNAVKTVAALLSQDYGHFDILFIDDGSADHTFRKVKEAFAGNDKVKVFTKPNGGKASALNFGISKSENDYVICIDADTQLQAGAVTNLMRAFQLGAKTTRSARNNDSVGAVAGNVKVGNENNLLTRWQGIEYTTAQNFDRRAFDLINCITVVPGAIGAFSKEAINEAGGFATDTLAEDCDLTIRMLRKGYRVTNCVEAIAVTEAPETVRQFMKQRFRWSYGVMQSFWKNKDACFHPEFKALGMVALPNILVFQVILPMLAPLADLMLIFSLIWNRTDPAGLHKIEAFYAFFSLVDVLVSAVAFSFEKENMKKLLWIIPQRFVYRQLMYIILFRAIRKAIKGESQSWGIMKRTGNVKPIALQPALSNN